MPTVGHRRGGLSPFSRLQRHGVNVPAENADADDTTGAFSADVLSPSRLQAAFFYSREDRARFTGMSEALRQNLSDALSGQARPTNYQWFDEGLLQRDQVLANHNVSTDEDLCVVSETYMSHFAFGRVDGKYASPCSGDLQSPDGRGDLSRHAAQRLSPAIMTNTDALIAMRSRKAGVDHWTA